MRDKFFLDTNIFVYTFFSDSPLKQEKAHQLIRSAVSDRDGCISYQVVQEFINVASKKFVIPLSMADCRRYFDRVLAPLCQVFANLGLFHRAIEIKERWGFSFYDALIVAGALQADCNILYSEDLQHEQKIRSLTIVNPFC